MKTLRLQLRFLIPLVLTLVAAAYLALPLMDSLTLRWFSRDLNLRGSLVTNALSDSIAEAMQTASVARLQPLFNRAVQDERLVAVALCSNSEDLLLKTAGYPDSLTCGQAQQVAQGANAVYALDSGSVQVGGHTVNGDDGPVANLVVLHDLSFVERRSQDTRKYLIMLIAALGITIAFITMVVAQLSWRGWVKGARALLRGEGLLYPVGGTAPELASFAADLRQRLRDMDDEYRRAQTPHAEWSPDRLRSLLRTQLRGDELIVVSNREPYIHEQQADGVVVKRPASGLPVAWSLP